jgi:hypothetical protein
MLLNDFTTDGPSGGRRCGAREGPEPNRIANIIILEFTHSKADHVVSYRYREFCGMKPIKFWTDLYGSMPNHTILAYSRIYEEPEVLNSTTHSGNISDWSTKNH